MKSYTSKEQAKKLAEILPLESADMRFCFSHTLSGRIIGHYPMIGREPSMGTIPCWSLAALFGLLPNCVKGAEPSLIKTFRNDYRIVYDIDGDENITSEDYTNPIDACYEMILRLHEQKLL